MKIRSSLLIMTLIVGISPAFAEVPSGGASGGGAIEGGEGAPGSGTGVPGAIIGGGSRFSEPAPSYLGFGQDYMAIVRAPVRRDGHKGYDR